jgi:tRNA(Ile)-lysidine synthetase-like protein
MALALLLSRWGRPLAVIVDHGLRAGSANEAALTASRLAGLGIEAIVVCASLAVGPAQSERAREARYGLLFAACEAAGVPDLLVAHHAGDQAETVQMRLAAGSGVLGLAGMAPISYRNAARVLRPLLGVDPARLRATLREAGVDWVEDPGNTDSRTVRGSLRVTMSAADRAAALALAEVSAAGRDRVLSRVAEELATVRLAPEGFAIVPGDLGGSTRRRGPSSAEDWRRGPSMVSWCGRRGGWGGERSSRGSRRQFSQEFRRSRERFGTGGFASAGWCRPGCRSARWGTMRRGFAIARLCRPSYSRRCRRCGMAARSYQCRI